MPAPRNKAVLLHSSKQGRGSGGGKIRAQCKQPISDPVPKSLQTRYLCRKDKKVIGVFLKSWAVFRSELDQVFFWVSRRSDRGNQNPDPQPWL